MVVMLIADNPETERKKIVKYAKEQAAYNSDDIWNFCESGSTSELESTLDGLDRVDISCIDLTMKDAISSAERVRRDFKGSYIVLVADTSISPVSYMRPSIRAESLMLKPLTALQLGEVLGEAVQAYMKRLSGPDERKVFLAENKGERNLIEYERILFFEAREKKVFLSTEREEYGFYDTLDELIKKLDGEFIRCHRSYIVNSLRISKVELSKDRIILDDGTAVPLSRSYKPLLKAFLKGGKVNGDHRKHSNDDV